MSPERHVKVFKNGRNQAIRIPREFEFSGEEAIMRKERRPAHHRACSTQISVGSVGDLGAAARGFSAHSGLAR